MTPQEASKVLAKAAAYDNRQPDQAAALAWSEALDRDLPLQDALRIVSEHYQDERTWIMPADINRRWRTLGKTRLANAERNGLPEAPDDIADDPQAWLTWKRTQIRAIKAGATHDQAEVQPASAANSPRHPHPATGRPCSTQQHPVKPSKRPANGLAHPGWYPYLPEGLKGPQNAIQRIDRTAGSRRSRAPTTTPRRVYGVKSTKRSHHHGNRSNDHRQSRG